MAVGVGVDFTAHIILAFILAEGDRNDRMEMATTFLGIVMLAFSNFQFIVKFYLLVYLLIVVLGAIDGLIFLPALLAVCGPPSISLPPAGEWKSESAAGLLPRQKKGLTTKPDSDFVYCRAKLGLPLGFCRWTSSSASAIINHWQSYEHSSRRNLGQPNYAATNSFLNCLTACRAVTRLDCRALSVDWGPWKEAGMAASTNEGAVTLWSDSLDHNDPLFFT